VNARAHGAHCASHRRGSIRVTHFLQVAQYDGFAVSQRQRLHGLPHAFDSLRSRQVAKRILGRDLARKERILVVDRLERTITSKRRKT
jgi:hypothetical protein